MVEGSSAIAVNAPAMAMDLDPCSMIRKPELKAEGIEEKKIIQ
jgi:hypothetical protein